MIRVRIFASLIALASLAVLTVSWPEAYTGWWQWGILGISVLLWITALWTQLPVFGSMALFIGFVMAAVLISLGANMLLVITGACLTLAAWMQSRLVQIAPTGARINHEMRVVRNLALYTLIISGGSLILGAVALNVHVPLPFFFAFIGAAALILFASRLVVWLRRLA
jgi:hypothetical protein